MWSDLREKEHRVQPHRVCSLEEIFLPLPILPQSFYVSASEILPRFLEAQRRAQTREIQPQLTADRTIENNWFLCF